jgi:protein gp37
MNITKIEWTDYSWNPITGCNNRCLYCYAKKMATRLKGRSGYDKDTPFKPTFHPQRLGQPISKTKQSMIFTCSMGDFFDIEVKSSWREDIYRVMDKAKWHAYQILTKQKIIEPEFRDKFPKNLWLGVSIDGTSRYWEEPFETLKKSSAVMKFISFEPLLGNFLPDDLTGIDWAIIGAQTGIGAKSVNPKIVNRVVELISSYDIPLFVKPNIRGQIPKNPGSEWVLREEFPQSFFRTRKIIEA